MTRLVIALAAALWLSCGPGRIETDKLDPVSDPCPGAPSAATPSPQAPSPSPAQPPAQTAPQQPATPLPVTGPCAELCQVVGGCTAVWPSADACQQECSAMKQVMRPSVTDAYIACGKKATCQSFAKKTCLRTGADLIQIQVTYPMVDRLCARTNTCLGGTMKPEDCENMKKDANMVGLLQQMKMYTDAVHNCIADCIQATSCANLFQDPANLSAQCSEKCGTRADWVTN